MDYPLSYIYPPFIVAKFSSPKIKNPPKFIILGMILFGVLLVLPYFKNKDPSFGYEVYYLYGFSKSSIVIFILGFSLDVIAFI